jgi:hypothetical protein
MASRYYGQRWVRRGQFDHGLAQFVVAHSEIRQNLRGAAFLHGEAT